MSRLLVALLGLLLTACITIQVPPAPAPRCPPAPECAPCSDCTILPISPWDPDPCELYPEDCSDITNPGIYLDVHAEDSTIWMPEVEWGEGCHVAINDDVAFLVCEDPIDE